jgi:hypothetical protein
MISWHKVKILIYFICSWNPTISILKKKFNHEFMKSISSFINFRTWTSIFTIKNIKKIDILITRRNSWNSSISKRIKQVYSMQCDLLNSNVLVLLERTKSLNFHMWWFERWWYLKRQISKSFGVELSSWTPLDRLCRKPPIPALISCQWNFA